MYKIERNKLHIYSKCLSEDKVVASARVPNYIKSLQNGLKLLPVEVRQYDGNFKLNKLSLCHCKSGDAGFIIFVAVINLCETLLQQWLRLFEWPIQVWL